jgi:hypothetical protein
MSVSLGNNGELLNSYEGGKLERLIDAGLIKALPAAKGTAAPARLRDTKTD